MIPKDFFTYPDPNIFEDLQVSRFLKIYENPHFLSSISPIATVVELKSSEIKIGAPVFVLVRYHRWDEIHSNFLFIQFKI